jgi:oligosaccharide reducing-end xylanase
MRRTDVYGSLHLAGDRTRRGAAGFAIGAAAVLCACGSTEDSLGYNDSLSWVGKGGASATGEYPNPFGEQLGLSDAEIDAKLDAAFEQLFYGDPNTEAIYFPVGDDAAYVEDINNADTRTDAVGYAMMLTVQLDRREEFDRIFTWADTYMRFSEGPYAGLFAWSCSTDGTECATTPDPNGTAYMATALLFAEVRWGAEGSIEYRAEAEQLLYLMLHLEERNGGVVNEAHNLFDAESRLVVYSPSGEGALLTAPSAHLPAFYELWVQAVPAERVQWAEVADHSRAFLHAVAHPDTGLVPARATLDADPIEGIDGQFGPEAYRIPLNIAIDWTWLGIDPWQIEEADRWLGFFLSQGLAEYVGGYALDGSAVAPEHANGTAAMIATIPERTDFIEDVWNLEIPTGDFRYYDGILYLLSLLTLSGNFRIYLP